MFGRLRVRVEWGEGALTQPVLEQEPRRRAFDEGDDRVLQLRVRVLAVEIARDNLKDDVNAVHAQAQASRLQLSPRLHDAAPIKGHRLGILRVLVFDERLVLVKLEDRVKGEVGIKHAAGKVG